MDGSGVVELRSTGQPRAAVTPRTKARDAEGPAWPIDPAYIPCDAGLRAPAVTRSSNEIGT